MTPDEQDAADRAELDRLLAEWRQAKARGAQAMMHRCITAEIALIFWVMWRGLVLGARP